VVRYWSGSATGGGQIGLGVAGAVLSLLTLRVLKLVERTLEQRRVSERWMKLKLMILKRPLRCPRFASRICKSPSLW
jgi:hypothetical protein